MALEITDGMIDNILLSNECVVIDFWAEWCAPCRILGPIIDQISKENKDFLVGKLDVSDNPETSSKYNITGIPCVIVFKNGVEVGRIKGVLSKSILLQKINEFRLL